MDPGVLDPGDHLEAGQGLEQDLAEGSKKEMKRARAESSVQKTGQEEAFREKAVTGQERDLKADHQGKAVLKEDLQEKAGLTEGHQGKVDMREDHPEKVDINQGVRVSGEDPGKTQVTSVGRQEKAGLTEGPQERVDMREGPGLKAVTGRLESHTRAAMIGLSESLMETEETGHFKDQGSNQRKSVLRSRSTQPIKRVAERILR